jgi:hypothetical protein
VLGLGAGVDAGFGLSKWWCNGGQGHVPVQVSGRSGAAARLGSEMEGPGYLTPMPLLSRLSSTFLRPLS